ncbi:MAG: hypothetical protein HYU36_15665 [Planctomycetes bacterium]|nr:hypothetical protein [Planctomycetota bacterium]
MPQEDLYKIPEKDGDVLVVPGLDELPGHVHANRELLDRLDVRVHGQPFSQLRLDARREALAVALPGRGDAGPLDPARPFILSGHQPEFLHPGIWLKNHLAASLARRLRGIAGHLIVDSDVPDQHHIHFPVIRSGEVRIRQLRILEDRPGVAYEELRMGDGADFEEVRQAVRDSSVEARIRRSLEELLARLPAGCPRGGRGAPFAVIASALRQSYEADFGLSNREMLLSSLCQTRSFQHFFLHLLGLLDPWREATNEALEAYRQRHHIRSPAHPLPNLEPDEMPFWVWRRGQPRQPLFARRVRHRFCLDNGNETLLEIQDPVESESAIQAVASLHSAGWRLRPRALATTAFCRLFLADLFIHGMGGAKYDRVTDAILGRFFGIRPPVYVAATGTFHLPLEAVIPRAERLDLLRYRARDVFQNPERYAPAALRSDPGFCAILAEKRALVREMPSVVSRPEKYARFVRIKALNRAMAGRLGPHADRAMGDLAAALSLRRQQAILQDRSYPFFLFPPEKLAGSLRRAGLSI